MMTLALSAGDLVINSHSYQTISGAAMIRQDLSLALIEPYGDDPYHPTWGSLLPSYVGLPLSSSLQMTVENEVTRVVTQFMNMQQATISNAQSRGYVVGYTTADVVVGITGVTSSISYDTLTITVSLVTAAGQGVSITRTVSLSS